MLDPKIQAAINLLKSGTEYQTYFFKRLDKIELLFDLKEQGLFSPENNPAPFLSEEHKGLYTILFWPALTYLEKVSKECTKPENIEYAKALMDIIRSVTRPDGDRNKRADNDRTWRFFVKIMANLPSELINIKDIELIADWLDTKFDASDVVAEISISLLPSLLKFEDKEMGKKVTRLIEILLDSVKDTSQNDSSSYWLGEMFRHRANLLGKKYGKKVLNIIKERLERILVKNDDKVSYIWRPAIEDNEQNIATDELRHILIVAFRDVFLSYADKCDALTFIRKCFVSQKMITKRVALYVLHKLFNKYRLLSESIINENLEYLFKVYASHHHEWYLFLKEHFMAFSPKLKQTLIKKVETLEGDWKEGADKERFDKEVRQLWLYLIKSTGYKLSSKIENEYLKNYKPDKYPEFLSYSGPLEWGTEKAFSPETLLGKGSVKKIIDFLNQYKGQTRWGEDNLAGAGEALADAIEANPIFFENDLAEFINVKPEYWYYLLKAFEDRWDQGKQISWNKVVSFVEEIIKPESKLWKMQEKKRPGLYPCQAWIVSTIADLIKKGVHKDERTMPEEVYGKAENILRILLDKQPCLTDKEFDENNATDIVINSSRGRVIEAFIQCCLHRYRMYEKLSDKGAIEKVAFWQTVESVFDKELKKAKGTNFEFSTLAGECLPNLYYLNKDWIKKNINGIFSDDNLKNWKAAWQGYSYVSTIYTDIYQLLKDNGHLRRVLNGKFANQQVVERAVQSTAIAYLREQEKLKDKKSLFCFVLDSWEGKNIRAIIDLFYGYKDANLPLKKITLILEFWEYCYARIKGQEDTHKDILSDLNLLAVFLKKIDKNSKDWLLQSAPYVEHRYHSAFVLEYLDVLADKSPKEVGEIFLCMLKSLKKAKKSLPVFRVEHIKSILKKVYDVKETIIADSIREFYDIELAGRDNFLNV